MDNKKVLSSMTVKELRASGKQNKVNITKEELITALLKQPEPQPADGKKSFFKKQTTTTTSRNIQRHIKRYTNKRSRRNKTRRNSTTTTISMYS